VFCVKYHEQLRAVALTVGTCSAKTSETPLKCFEIFLGHLRRGGARCRKILPVSFRRLSQRITDL